MAPPISPRSGVTRRRPAALLTLAALLTGSAVSLMSLSPAQAATPAILLGTSDSFAILAGSGITNTGATSIAGDVGTFPTPSMTGFDTVTLDGVNHGGDAVTQEAKDDLTTAYNQAAESGPTAVVDTELGGKTLTPGVYGNDTLEITGTLTLDTQGNPDAVFVFQAATTLTTATDSAVVVLGGGEACNVFWQIGSSTTLGVRSHLVGTVLAETSITATTGATIQGRLLARTGAVTLEQNIVTRAVCADSAVTTQVDTTTTIQDTTTTTTLAASTPTIPGDGENPASTVPVTAAVSLTPTPSAAVPPVEAPPANRPPASGTPTPGVPRLPYTGIDVGSLTLAGLAVLGVGTSSLYLSRRRHASLGADLPNR